MQTDDLGRVRKCFLSQREREADIVKYINEREEEDIELHKFILVSIKRERWREGVRDKTS